MPIEAPATPEAPPAIVDAMGRPFTLCPGRRLPQRASYLLTAAYGEVPMFAAFGAGKTGMRNQLFAITVVIVIVIVAVVTGLLFNHNTYPYAMAFLLTFAFYRAASRRKYTRWDRGKLVAKTLGEHICPACGHDLRGLPAEPDTGLTICPECGAAWRLPKPPP